MDGMSDPPVSPERIESAAQMLALLRRDDLPTDRDWWQVATSVCNTGLISAEAGNVGADLWADALGEALDRSVEPGAADLTEALSRRVLAAAAAMHYFGPEPGRPMRDPELIFERVLAPFGDSPEVFGTEFARIRAETQPPPTAAKIAAVRWMNHARNVLDHLVDVATHLPDGPVRAAVMSWTDLRPVLQFGTPPSGPLGS
jgi:hypothetical protein